MKENGKNEFLWPFLANNPLEISIWCILLISTFTTKAFKLNRQWSKATSAKIPFCDPLSCIPVSDFRSLTRTFLYKGSSAKHYEVDDNDVNLDDDGKDGDDDDDDDGDDDNDDIVYCGWKCKLPTKFVRTCTS